LRFRHLAVLFPVALILALMIISVYAQYGGPSLTISPTTVQLGDAVNFNWGCPSGLIYYYPSSSSHAGSSATLPFIFAQITVTRMQEYPTSIPPYFSPQLQSLSGTLPYVAPTNGTFTAILRCYYDGSGVGLGYYSCPACRDGGQFVVTSPPAITTTTTSSSTISSSTSIPSTTTSTPSTESSTAETVNQHLDYTGMLIPALAIGLAGGGAALLYQKKKTDPCADLGKSYEKAKQAADLDKDMMKRDAKNLLHTLNKVRNMFLSNEDIKNWALVTGALILIGEILPELAGVALLGYEVEASAWTELANVGRGVNKLWKTWGKYGEDVYKGAEWLWKSKTTEFMNGAQEAGQELERLEADTKKYFTDSPKADALKKKYDDCEAERGQQAAPAGSDDASLTDEAGDQCDDVTPGTSMAAGNTSFWSRLPSGSRTGGSLRIAPKSKVKWEKPPTKTPPTETPPPTPPKIKVPSTPPSSVPWLRLPEASQVAKMENLHAFRMDSGKLMLNWTETAARKEAILALPELGSWGAALAAPAAKRWLAHVKGTLLLAEGTAEGSAVEVIKGDVEVWNSGDPENILTIHAGELLVMKPSRQPEKITLELDSDLIEALDVKTGRWWSLPPMDDRSLAALTGK